MLRIAKCVEQMSQALQRGRPELALTLAGALSGSQEHPSILHLLGLANAQLGQPLEAEVFLRNAYMLEQENPQFARDLLELLHQNGKFDDAKNLVTETLLKWPDDIEFLALLAKNERALGNLDAAALCFREALETAPSHCGLWSNLALVLSENGQVDASLAAWRHAVQLEPDNLGALNGLAALNIQRGEFEDARAVLARALALSPEDINSRANLSFLELKQENYEAALEVCATMPASWRESHNGRAIVWGAHDGLGRAQLATGLFDLAETSFRAALIADSGCSSSAFNLGQVLRVHGRWQEAVASYERALALDSTDLPAAMAARLTLPIVYQNENERSESRERYRAGLDLLLEETADSHLVERLTAIGHLTGRTNFQLAYQQEDDVVLQRNYGQWLSNRLRGYFAHLEKPSPPRRERVRVGFVSSFWWRHTVGKLFRGWVEKINPSQFEIFVYHLGTIQDDVTQSLALAADSYVNIQGFDEQVNRIVKDAPDILIYPELGMDGPTFGLAALRLAPIQCVAWGHPMTSGLPTVDYFLTSDAMEPAESESSYSEQLVRLPNLSVAYQRPELPEDCPPRSHFGLDDDQVLYLACQSLFKYLPGTDWLFTQIAQAVPSAHFVFINNKSTQLTAKFRTRLTGIFAAAGLDFAQRATMLGPLALPDYLALNSICDVYLDSPGWSGGNTSLEALAWGLPMVSLRGQWMRGRHTAAILEQMDMGAWVADDPDGYVEKAVALGTDSGLRKRVRGQLLERSAMVYGDLAPIRSLESFLLGILNSSAK